MYKLVFTYIYTVPPLEQIGGKGTLNNPAERVNSTAIRTGFENADECIVRPPFTWQKNPTIWKSVNIQ